MCFFIIDGIFSQQIVVFCDCNPCHEEAAQQLVEKILHQYIGVFVSLEQQIRARYGDEVLEQL